MDGCGIESTGHVPLIPRRAKRGYPNQSQPERITSVATSLFRYMDLWKLLLNEHVQK